MPRSSPAHNPSVSRQDIDARAASDDAVWEEFAALFDSLEQLAATPLSYESFYASLLDGCVEALAALGGAVWLRTADGFRVVTTQGPQPSGGSPEQLQQEDLLQQLESSASSVCLETSGHYLTAAPVVVDQTQKRVVAAIVLTLRVGRAAEFYEACQRLLEGAAQIAATVHAKQQLADTQGEVAEARQLLAFARRVSGDPSLGATAYRIANECRTLLGCDRVSVLQVRKRRTKLLAVSGAESFERRSGAVRRLEQLGRLARTLDQPLAWPDSTIDEHLQTELDAYCDASHARSVCLAPITIDTEEDETRPDALGVLVVESFDAEQGPLVSSRIAGAASACAPALQEAIRWDAIPLAPQIRQFGRLLRFGVALKSLFLVSLVAAAIAALVFVRIEHRVTLSGTLQPVEQRSIFAPANALVEHVHVENGQQVNEGSPLFALSSPELLLEIQRLEGELSEVETQRQSTAAARTSADPRGDGALEALELAAEGRRLELRSQSLQAEIALLRSQRDDLVVTSPIAGMIVTWEPEQLAARPVERGQKLLMIAASNSAWRLELDAPDDRIGLILDAQSAHSEPLRVAYETLSGAGHTYWGRLARVAPQATVDTDHSSSAWVRVEVDPNQPKLPLGDTASALPGETVRAKIYCGEQALGYVWLHDAWEMLTRWWRL